ncbi:hypothetical protein GT034_09465 [Streptomyces sp. SID2563]|uniref:hypothetical protein n=1 Tax=Streptomyces sp. SID2563 TaxID=2690255 RepID=UPI00136C10E2|nr:hypothetical protein [Streptomyces sp. SID2563]MYW08570.1 hypothetical protein [Streptomyces sp. SID2563]
MKDDFANGLFQRAWEPTDYLVVYLDRISSGLSSPLDYPVMLHTMALLEEWRMWDGPGRLVGVPEPDRSSTEVLRRLTAAGIAWPDGRVITESEVLESLHRLATVGAVRGLQMGGDAR